MLQLYDNKSNRQKGNKNRGTEKKISKKQVLLLLPL